MFRKLGIGGRLFAAFAVIAGLSLISGVAGWLEIRQVADSQETITEKVLPVAIEAQLVAEVSARLVAGSPLLTGAATEHKRKAEATALFLQADELRGHLKNLERSGLPADQFKLLNGTVDGLLENLAAQDRLVAKRIFDRSEFRGRLATAITAAVDLSDLSETLVSNATAGTSAVISNLYDLVEDPDSMESTLEALDRLAEWDLFQVEQMFELRLRSSQTGLLFNQLGATSDDAELEWIENTMRYGLQILARRISGIPDPVRISQAKELYGSLQTALNGQRGNNLFALRRAILNAETQIDLLASKNRELTEELDALVVTLLDNSRALMETAKAEADESVQVGIVTVIGLTLLSLLAASVIIWFYVQGNVVNRLAYLANSMRQLARGNLNIDVEASGNDELTNMAKAIRFFKTEAVKKRELEQERERTAEELRRHRNELQDLVAERTEQLSTTNDRLLQEAQDHAIARERAERASKAKTEFLATMSHEIRTPMNGMLGVVRMLGITKLTDDQQEKLRIVETSGEALLGILNDILDYSKIESGHLEIDRIDFDLRRLVEGICLLLEPRAHEKGLYLTGIFGENVPQRLNGDPGKLRQILFNLIGNGLKFTQQGGVTVRIETTSGGPPDGCALRFEVQDTGIGVPEQDKQSVFEAFVQQDASISRRYGGTGLGLTISKKLVNALGGAIDVESTEGQGSTFWFELEFSEAQAEVRQAPAAVPDVMLHDRPLSVLVVEDNEVNRLVAQSFLEDMGHSVQLATTGQGAIDSVITGEPDVVLMDISLPGMDGIEATKRIRALSDPRKRNIPIVAVSAHVFKSEIDEQLKAGMDGFLGKPISPERLAQVLSEAVISNDSVPKPIDLAVIKRTDNPRDVLEEDLSALGEERVERMIGLFLENTPARLEQLESAVSGGDLPAVSGLAHYLKSSARQLGLGKTCGPFGRNRTGCARGADRRRSRLVPRLR